jgi:DNA polymerase I
LVVVAIRCSATGCHHDRLFVIPVPDNDRVLQAVVPDGSGGAWFARLADDGRPVDPPRVIADPDALAAEVARVEAEAKPRWLWPSTADLYPILLRAGVRVDRCHDAELTEAMLLGYEGSWGAPRGFAAAVARLTGEPVLPDPPPGRGGRTPSDGQVALFEAVPAAASPLPEAMLDVFAAQRARIEQTEHPGRFRMLVAVESAGALLAAEMGRDGLPWRADVHDALLRELLGEPSPIGGRPRRLVELAAQIDEAFGYRVQPDSPAELLRAFSRAGITLGSTRRWELQQIDHPAVPLLVEYKELSRIWTAHGWAWRDQWVRDDRFYAEWVPAGVVSGRWASRGGGALQIPKVIRRAVVADPGWVFVVADAGQLEPRILAAVSGDQRLAAAARHGDLYAALAADAFGGDRARAKVAMLGAMYGQTGGQAAPALAALRRFYPTAWDYVEQAARTGEQGGLVRSWLGRTCPPSSASVEDLIAYDPGDGVGPRANARARARGRFTRNFVIQATAAEWALVLLARLRAALAAGDGSSARLVFFQHDEVMVHCPAELAADVTRSVQLAGEEARTLLFGDTSVRFPLDVSIVDCYADAK